MKIAIVGSSNLTENEERDARQTISYIIKSHIKPTIISGGAPGIDTIAIEVAKGLNIPFKEIEPRFQGWKAYKERNIAIAQDCNVLFCISTPIHKTSCYHCHSNDHERTGGCWTMKYAKSINKPTRLFITPIRYE